MARPPLSVWLYGTRVGTLSEPKFGKLRFDCSDVAERRFGLGALVLSVSMPLDSRRRPRGDVVRAWFTALLPESSARGQVERLYGVRSGDDFGLLAAVGLDCAGAVTLRDPGCSEVTGSAARIEPLTDDGLAEAVRRLPERPLGADADVRVSLAGAQEKLLLAKTPGGQWGRPVAGAPSTHILKPQDMRLDGYAAGEAFCLRLAGALGLTTVETEVLDIDGRPTVAVSRYDRLVEDGLVSRLHQEDSCQALSVDVAARPERKYQALGGPSLRQVAEILANGNPGDLSRLLALTTLNVAVGNADCHARNLSLVHDPDGGVQLAPAYDVTPTTFYRGIPTSEGTKDMTDDLGMFVGGKRSVHDVDVTDLVEEGSSWGLPRSEAEAVVEETVERIGSNLRPLASTLDGLPGAIPEWVESRQEALTSGRAAGVATSRRIRQSPPGPNGAPPTPSPARRPAGRPVLRPAATGVESAARQRAMSVELRSVQQLAVLDSLAKRGELAEAHLRPRRADDLPACVSALRAVHLADGYPLRWPEDPGSWLSPSVPLRTWVAEEAGAILGHVALCPVAADDPLLAILARPSGEVGEIKRLFVVPSARRRHLGTELLAVASAAAAAIGLVPVLEVLERDEAAIYLYERLGWKLVGRRHESWYDSRGGTLLIRVYASAIPIAVTPAGSLPASEPCQAVP